MMNMPLSTSVSMFLILTDNRFICISFDLSCYHAVLSRPLSTELLWLSICRYLPLWPVTSSSIVIHHGIRVYNMLNTWVSLSLLHTGYKDKHCPFVYNSQYRKVVHPSKQLRTVLVLALVAIHGHYNAVIKMGIMYILAFLNACDQRMGIVCLLRPCVCDTWYLGRCIIFN